mmetsp:Transcript_45879/g.130989  ORF Transcript_45879/g.130989 Transcript_45879/m.130989 type:complete len:201 (+) Transcript_45879:40-642(+)
MAASTLISFAWPSTTALRKAETPARAPGRGAQRPPSWAVPTCTCSWILRARNLSILPASFFFGRKSVGRVEPPGLGAVEVRLLPLAPSFSGRRGGCRSPGDGARPGLMPGKDRVLPLLAWRGISKNPEAGAPCSKSAHEDIELSLAIGATDLPDAVGEAGGGPASAAPSPAAAASSVQPWKLRVLVGALPERKLMLLCAP